MAHEGQPVLTEAINLAQCYDLLMIIIRNDDPRKPRDPPNMPRGEILAGSPSGFCLRKPLTPPCYCLSFQTWIRSCRLRLACSRDRCRLSRSLERCCSFCNLRM